MATTKRTTKAAPTTTSTTSKNPNSSVPPPPFSTAPPSTTPLTSRLDPSKIYITHFDRHPIHQKQTIFLIPILINLIVAALLLWRLSHALPTYYILILTSLRYQTSATVDTHSTTFAQQLGVLLRRVGMMLVDYLLTMYMLPWPVTFFFEQPANPCSYRWKCGFREKEVVMRVSRGWGKEELLDGRKKGGESAFWKTRVNPAVEREEMEKVGYLMMGKDWDLDFEGMGMVEMLIERGEVVGREVEGVVWGFVEGVGWCWWRFLGAEEDGDGEEKRRMEVVRFKEVLVGMGKEGLFWRWTEIVEEERGRDGGFSEEGKVRVEERVRKECEREGVDFEEVRRKVGGDGGSIGEVPLMASMPAAKG